MEYCWRVAHNDRRHVARQYDVSLHVHENRLYYEFISQRTIDAVETNMVGAIRDVASVK